MANLHQLLKAMIEKGASDLHITTDSPPQLRIDGELVPLKMPPLTPVETKQLAYSILTDAQKHHFEEENELDLSFGVKNLSRFRANIYMQRGAVAQRASPANTQRKAHVGVEHAVFLHVRAFADLDPLVVATHHAAKPDADIAPQPHLAHDVGIGGEPVGACRGQVGGDSIKRVNWHRSFLRYVPQDRMIEP